MRIAAFPAKIARWADAGGLNETFVLHWRKCFSIRSRSKQVRTAVGGTPPFRATGGSGISNRCPLYGRCPALPGNSKVPTPCKCAAEDGQSGLGRQSKMSNHVTACHLD